MILDNFGKVTKAVTGSGTGTSFIVSAESIDLGADRSAMTIGAGEGIEFLFHVTAAAAGSGNAYTVEVISSTAAALDAGVVAISSQDFTEAQMAHNTQWSVKIPADVANALSTGRYLGFQIKKGHTDDTITLSATVVTGVQTVQKAS